MVKYEFKEDLQILSHKVFAFYDGRIVHMAMSSLNEPDDKSHVISSNERSFCFSKKKCENKKLPEMIFETFTTYSHRLHARYVNVYMNFINSYNIP